MSPIPGFRPYLDGAFDAPLDLQQHVYRRALASIDRGRAVNDALADPAAVTLRQQQIRATVTAALGGLLPTGDDVPAQLVGVTELAGYQVHRLLLATRPGTQLPANLYLPDDLTGPTGAVLFVCGHGEQAKAYPPYQAVCARLARNGIVALIIDPVGQGERIGPGGPAAAGIFEHTDLGVRSWWTGHSVGRYFVHDAQRAIDYLCRRPEVDPARIGMTGNSGGGTLTALLMAVEPRLAAAAPGTYLTSRSAFLRSGAPHDAEQVLPSAGQAGLDHEDFLIAMAPRPVLVLAVEYDFFPLEGTLDTVRRAGRVYGLLDAADRLALARVPATHQYHPDLAKAATAFFVRELGDGRVPDDTDPVPLTAAELACDPPPQPHLAQSHEFHLEPADPAAALEWLRGRVYAHRELPEEFFTRWPSVDNRPDVRHALWRPEADLWNAAVVVHPESPPSGVTLALFPDGTGELAERTDWISAQAAAGQVVLVLDVRGTGTLRPRPSSNWPDEDGYFGASYRMFTELLWLDDSLAAGRIFDVLRAVDFVQSHPWLRQAGPLRLYAAGDATFYGYLAGALESRLSGVELTEAPVEPRNLLAAPYTPGPVPQWRNVVPGLAARFALADLRPSFAGRDLRIGS
ncbi:dienelactone hydrolase [Hamadaea flava]|uniref:Alpha/beta hydrolase family protein n=1 Tax=Hamadaea flava TaxID=1742688 RepID=A0ABV8LGU9_9ACTN|nr:acetylxylan esterase [Hamadaea flava]MCP2324234.1 dienelactone hydrolase [Hamadaea flava]